MQLNKLKLESRGPDAVSLSLDESSMECDKQANQPRLICTSTTPHTRHPQLNPASPP